MKSFVTSLCHAIDYAGLFPPASLDLGVSVENYAAYQASDEGWALGRLMLPASALSRYQESYPTLACPVSVLLGSEFLQDIEVVSRQDQAFDTFECKVSAAGSIERIVRLLTPGAQVFFEVDARTVTSDLIAAIRQAGAAAKIRTGGLTPEAIPPAAMVAHFLALCHQHQVPFKATAGLHHPIRSAHPLTYQADAPIGIMHGFVNVMVSAALLALGAAEEDVCAVLMETDSSAFQLNDEGLSWRDTTLSVRQISAMRKNSMLGFGSCSFTEPIADSKALGWLP
jgi:hypothetical protein